MEINSFTESDTEALEAFKVREWKIADEEHYGNNPPDFVEKSYTLLAKEDGHIVGQIRFEVSQGIAKIESLLVGKESQRKGVGIQLIQSAEASAKNAGAHKISLETGSLWPAKQFYEKLGYKVRAVLPNDVAFQEFVLMDKMLDVPD